MLPVSVHTLNKNNWCTEMFRISPAHTCAHLWRAQHYHSLIHTLADPHLQPSQHYPALEGSRSFSGTSSSPEMSISTSPPGPPDMLVCVYKDRAVGASQGPPERSLPPAGPALWGWVRLPTCQAAPAHASIARGVWFSQFLPGAVFRDLGIFNGITHYIYSQALTLLI